MRRAGLRPGDTIAEATSGNTGIAFAALGRALGHPVTIFMPDWMSRERMDSDPEPGRRRRAGDQAAGRVRGQHPHVGGVRRGAGTVFLPRQFANTANVEAHASTTGPEICICSSCPKGSRPTRLSPASAPAAR